MPYDFGWLDELVDIHFPRHGNGGGNQDISEPWFWFVKLQTPTYFSFLGQTWGPGWGARMILPVIKILAVDTQPMVPTTPVGYEALEDAADRYVDRWDGRAPGGPLDIHAYGRMNFKDTFFWKTLGKKYPAWASNLDTLPSAQPNNVNGAIGPYIEKAVTQFWNQWNTDSLMYNAGANGVGPTDGFISTPFTNNSFALPYPHPIAKEGGAFSKLQKQLTDEKAWFGPIPESAWTNFNTFTTQSYAFTYGFGQLDDSEWDMSRWPPRRSSLLIDKGGSGRPPSGVSGNYNGKDPFATMLRSQLTLV